MRTTSTAVLLGLLLCAGCTKSKSTDDFIADLKSGTAGERVAAVRSLPQRNQDASIVVPALIECLKDKQVDVRLNAAIGLGEFGEEAKPAIPDLRTAEKDGDARVRRAAGIAVTRIDPSLQPTPRPAKSRKK